MPSVRIERKPAFEVVGQAVFITGQDNEQFARFWQRSHQNGLIDRLRAIGGERSGNVTNSRLIGVSRVEADPSNRAFSFVIGTEPCLIDTPPDLVRFSVPQGEWAIFSERGADAASALIACEMFAFLQWLPQSGYEHAFAPELETYPDDGSACFWLPLIKKA